LTHVTDVVVKSASLNFAVPGLAGNETAVGNALNGAGRTAGLGAPVFNVLLNTTSDNIAGFALAGGGTNFVIANGVGSGRSDLFQAGAYMRHTMGAAYIAGALAYGAKGVTDPRSELGFRTDKSFALVDTLPDTILTLRGRFAWAHDYETGRSIGATFQTLPGASFVVNGAAQSPDKALTTAAAEVKWRNGVSLSGVFEGEFGSNVASYAGKGVARYRW
jgi:uncharacterized protein with beta-barrel porin domain